MTDRVPSFPMDGVNRYVPAMQFSSYARLTELTRVGFGTPKAADTDGVHAAIAANATSTVTTFVPGTGGSGATSDANYGQNVTAKASGATGANWTGDIYGLDYLGQPVRETLTVANGDGTNTIAGKKAFKKILKIVNNGGASNAVTVDIGWGSALGLPYKAIRVAAEYIDRVSGTVGTFVAPIETDPQTVTTGDPRGTYAPTTAANGTRVIEADVAVNNYVNASGNGGLHGIKHLGV